MHYPELATVQVRLAYRLTSFLLENLATGHTVEWMDAFRAQRHVAETLGIADRELPWLATRVDPRGHNSFGRRMSRKIVCGDCGRTFGHKTWHSGTPNRVDVWECPTNYIKRGTCATSHLYQEVLLVKMAEALQVLAERNRAAVDQAVDSLQSTGVRDAHRRSARRSTSSCPNRRRSLRSTSRISLPCWRAGACSPMAGSASCSSPARPSPSTSRNAGVP